MPGMDLLNLSIEASKNFKGCLTTREHLITSPCIYYHYLCDDIDDRGWGCGYRSLQCLCSWAVSQRHKKCGVEEKEKGELEDASVSEERSKEWKVPSLREIQETLVEVGDKMPEFIGSREWIGTFETCLVLDHLYSVACKIVHVHSGAEVVEHIDMLARHFDTIGSPVMIGGDVDGSSKTLIGVLVEHSKPSTARFLIADPHYVNCSTDEGDTAVLLCEKGLGWHGLEVFQKSSYYNFCLPQPLSTH